MMMGPDAASLVPSPVRCCHPTDVNWSQSYNYSFRLMKPLQACFDCMRRKLRPTLEVRCLLFFFVFVYYVKGDLPQGRMDHPIVSLRNYSGYGIPVVTMCVEFRLAFSGALHLTVRRACLALASISSLLVSILTRAQIFKSFNSS